MGDFRNAMLAGIALVICSLGLYSLGPNDPIGGCMLLPGVIVGIYASVIASGNPHGVSLILLLVVACFVNYFFYTILVYCLLRFYHRSSKSEQVDQ
jgi:hypothetical protein